MPNRTIAETMLRHVNTWEDKPVERVTLDELMKEPPCLMLQQLSGEKIERKYLNGSYIGNYPFALYMRVSTVQTLNRLNAISTLTELGHWLEDNPPALENGACFMSLGMTALPSQIAQYEDGSSDYQAVFSLKYKQGVC